jgi:hypothetical protein
MRLDRETATLVPGAEKLRKPVVKAVSAIYGIGRAGHDHERGRNEKIAKAKWVQLKGSRSVWYQDFPVGDESRRMFLVVYVDDFLLIGSNRCMLAAWATLDCMGWKPKPPTKFLGVQYHVSVKDGMNQIALEQCEYASYIVQEYQSATGELVRPAKTPAQEWQVYTKEEITSKGVCTEAFVRRMLGLLQYLARGTRYELKYAINRLARNLLKWTIACDKELRRVVRYVNGTLTWGVGITVDPNEKVGLVFDVDADHGNDALDRRSVSGSVAMLVGKRSLAYVGGQSKAQSVAERSSGGSECNAISAGVASFFRTNDMVQSGLEQAHRTRVRCDSAVAISAVEKGYSRAMYYLSKHAGTELAFLHDVFFPPKGDKVLELVKVASAENRSDAHTKPLAYTLLAKAREMWGMFDLVRHIKLVRHQ